MIRRLIILLLIVGCEDNSTEPAPEDCAGVEGGSAVEDCAGVCGGNTVEDVCGICGGENRHGDNFTTINDVEWILDEYTITNNQATWITATGMITNTGNTPILAPWWVEAEFYSDSTFTLILGRDRDSFYSNLESGLSTQWTLRYSGSGSDSAWASQNTVEANYLNFAINNFRAFRDECP